MGVYTKILLDILFSTNFPAILQKFRLHILQYGIEYFAVSFYKLLLTVSMSAIEWLSFDKLLTDSTSVVEWYKSHAHISFSKVIQILIIITYINMNTV